MSIASLKKRLNNVEEKTLKKDMSIEEALAIIPDSKVHCTGEIYIWLGHQGFKLEEINDYIMRLED